MQGILGMIAAQTWFQFFIHCIPLTQLHEVLSLLTHIWWLITWISFYAITLKAFWETIELLPRIQVSEDGVSRVENVLGS